MNHVRFALRQLLRRPGFTLVAVLTLAICLGANLTILAVVDAILIRALPFAAPDRLAILYNSYPGAGIERLASSLPNYFDRRGALKAFDSVAIYQEASVIVGDGGNPRRISTMRVSPEFFATLGVPLAMGRTFSEANLAYRADEVAILTDEFWRGHFNADPQVLGRTFDNDGARIAVIGVLPRGYRFLSSRAMFYRPASHAPDDRHPRNRHAGDWNMIARLAPGVRWSEAQSQMDVFNAQQLRDDPAAELVRSSHYRTHVRSLHEDHVRQVRRTLVLLQAGVAFLLVIGVVNLANLLLIRMNGRTQEIAVRQALGAGRWRIAREQLIEVMLLVAGAGLAGLLLGAVGLRFLSVLGANQLPLGSAIRLDGRTMAAALAAALVVGATLAALVIGFSLRPALAEGLKLGMRTGTMGRGGQRLRHAFVIAQVALAFVLLAGAGLLGFSLKRVLEAPVGFDTVNVMAGSIAFPWSSYTNQPSRLAFVDRLLADVRALPGVTHAAVTSALPFGAPPSESAIAVEGRVPDTGALVRAHFLCSATGDYWPAMGIRLFRGRMVEDADRHREPRASVVDQSFAERYWRGEDPIGRRFSIGNRFNPEDAVVVVGVVGDVKHADLAEEAGHGMVYLPYPHSWPKSFSLVVRATAPFEAMAPAMRKAVTRCDPGMPIDDLRPLQSRIDDTVVARRSPAVLSGVFAGVALLLAALGTYGVLAYAVSQREREIGLRMALGAQRGDVLIQFFWQGAKLCLAGLVLGLAGAWAAGHAMKSVLFGVGSFHPGAILVAGIALAAVVVPATLVPSRRAARADPMEALRAE